MVVAFGFGAVTMPPMVQCVDSLLKPNKFGFEQVVEEPSLGHIGHLRRACAGLAHLPAVPVADRHHSVRWSIGSCRHAGIFAVIRWVGDLCVHHEVNRRTDCRHRTATLHAVVTLNPYTPIQKALIPVSTPS
jgi:hypothetical protein